MSKRYQGGILGVGFNPLQAPNAPTGATATVFGASGQASVSFTAPTTVGGSSVTSYAVISNPGGFGGAGATSPITVSGLSNGTSYTFQVSALNTYGPSPYSISSNAVTPYIAYPRIETFSGLTNFVAGVSSRVQAASYLAFTNYVVQLNESGTIAWQKTTATQSLGAVVSDASGNVYVTGSGSGLGWVGKFNSSGTLLWQTTVKENSYTYSGPYPGNPMVDSAGNLYVSGNHVDQFGYYNGYFAKFDTSGNVVFQKSIPNNNASAGGNAAKDPLNDVFYNSTTWNNGGSRESRTYKSSTTGTYSWYVTVSLGYPNQTYHSIPAIDTSGNVYLPANGNISGGGIASTWVKVTSAGALVWKKWAYDGSARLGNGYYAASSPASGFTYLSFINSSDSYVMKIDGNANIIWQKKFNVTGQQLQLQVQSVDSNDNVYLSAYMYNQPCGIVVVPSAGPTNGTYTNNGLTYTVSTSTLTLADATLFTVSLNTSSGTFNDATNVTSVAASATFTNASLTPVITSL